MIGIYKIENKVNGKVYIGKSTDIEERWRQHVRMLNKGCHHSTKLQVGVNGDGMDSFDFKVIESVDNDRNLASREKHYIDYYDSINNGYNMVDVRLSKKSKKISKRLLEELKNEWYEVFNTSLDLFKKDVSVRGSTYSHRLFSKHYSHIHYRKCAILLSYAYQNYYNAGDVIVLDILLHSIRVSNKTTNVCLILKNIRDGIKIWEGDFLLKSESMTLIDISDKTNELIKCNNKSDYIHQIWQ